jgi:hypothetical protein
MPRPALEVADILRDHGAAWRRANASHVSLGQMKVMSAIERCRTAALGGHVARCENQKCAHTIIAYNSCRNRHCPKCQGAAAAPPSHTSRDFVPWRFLDAGLPSAWMVLSSRRPKPAQTQTSYRLLDHLVGAGEKHRRDDRPSAFAVLRLTVSSNLSGACTGTSPGDFTRAMSSDERLEASRSSSAGKLAPS